MELTTKDKYREKLTIKANPKTVSFHANVDGSGQDWVIYKDVLMAYLKNQKKPPCVPTREVKKEMVDEQPDDVSSDIEFSVVKTNISESANHNDVAAHLSVECVLDYWLKYGATYFNFEFGVEKKGMVSMWFNKGLDKKENKKYWKTHEIDGWDVNGNFMKREWRGLPNGGGKSGY